MALNSGFDRFEGTAYFGYDLEGEGYDAIVVIGQNVIEIRDTNDTPLSQWIAGTYSCNDEQIPLRAYFHGDEWIAPHDHELQERLDQFVAVDRYSDFGTRKRSWSWVWVIIVISVLAVISYFALRPLTDQLLSPAIRDTLDDDIIANFETSNEICNPSMNAIAHEKIISKTKTPDFVVLPAQTQNYARLPSGRLSLNAEFLQNLDNAETLAALLQLAKERSESHDPASELLTYFPLMSRVTFLANAEVDQAELEAAWQNYAQSEAFPPSMHNELKYPKGNYRNLSGKIGWPQGNYSSEDYGIVLTDDEWESLFTFCESEQ